MAGPELPVIYENPRFDKATPTLWPVFDKATRFILVILMEWGTLTLIEDSPRYVKLATMIVAALGLAVHESWPWLRMRDWRWYPSLMGALVIIYLGIFFYGISTEPSHKSSSDEIAAAVIKALPPSRWDAGANNASGVFLGLGQTTIGNLTIPIGDRILEQPKIDWDGSGPIIFEARVDHPIEKMPIYLDWGLAGPGTQVVLNMGMMGNPRVEIGFIERLAVGQMMSVTIGEVTPPQNGQQQTLQWGEAHYNNPKTGINGASYMARIVLIRKDGKEEQYPFLLVARTNSTPPTIVSPGLLEGMIIR